MLLMGDSLKPSLVPVTVFNFWHSLEVKPFTQRQVMHLGG